MFQDRGQSFQPQPLYAGENAALAVMPFRVTGSGLEEWEEGMVDLLSTGLDGTAGLRAVDGRTIIARWNQELGDVANPDLADALGVAASTGARFAIEGSVVSIGNEVRLVARVHDLEGNAQIGVAQVEGSIESPHNLIDSLGLEVLRVLLGGEVADLPRVNLAAVTTDSNEALRAYLEGERHYRAGRWEDAAGAYQEATVIDSTFALAYHRLDLALGWFDVGNPLQTRARASARALADRLPERERLLVTGIYRMVRSDSDPTELETPIEQAVELYPNDGEAWYLLGETYFHNGDLIMRPSEVEAVFERAIALEPDFAGYRIHHVEYAFSVHGDSALAARRVAEYREVTDPDDPLLGYFEAGLKALFGDSLTRAAALDSLFSLPDALYADVGLPTSFHPALLAASEPFTRRWIERILSSAQSSVTGSEALRFFGRLLANQGRISEALDVLDHPAIADSDRRCLLVEFSFLELPVPDDMVQEMVDDLGVQDEDATGTFCGSLLAAELGVRTAVDAGRERLLALEQNLFAGLLGVYWAWRQDGAHEDAARALEREGFGSIQTHYWTFWLGETYRELNDLEAAEEAYLTSLKPWSNFQYTLTWYRLAGIYDQLGDRDAARHAWQLVLAAWENADPEIQPRVEEARERLAALQ